MSFVLQTWYQHPMSNQHCHSTEGHLLCLLMNNNNHFISNLDGSNQCASKPIILTVLMKNTAYNTTNAITYQDKTTKHRLKTLVYSTQPYSLTTLVRCYMIRLHWLVVPQRIRYKLCLLVYKALHGLAQYLTDFCQPVSFVSGRSGLRSSTRSDLIVVSTSTNFGRRSFAVSAPAAWNQLPSDIRNLQSLGSFKHRLKTHSFNCN